MRLILFCMRVCLAAHFAGKNAETLLGRQGHVLKRIIEHTHLADFILWLFIKNPGAIMGIGGQSIVIRSATRPDSVEKYSYTLAGADKSILADTIHRCEADQADIEKQFSGLALHTEYFIAPLPLRWPFSTLTTICSRQQQLKNYVDIFDAETANSVRGYDPAVRNDIARLALRTREWYVKNKWLDLIGPNNIVITTDSGTPSVRIIDTGLYAPEYMSGSNPVLGRTYHEVFVERLKIIEAYTVKLSLLLILVIGYVLCYRHNHLTPHHLYAFLDAVEDKITD